MLLNAEELLALVNGDAEPDRLADLLDRLENCPDSAAALQVLVALRANREEGLEALREAAEADSAQPIPHPSSRRPATTSTRWSTQPLRLAASIAIVGILGILAATTFLGTPSVTSLATVEYQDTFLRDFSIPEEPTSDFDYPSFEQVATAISEQRYTEARSLLGEIPRDEASKIAMYHGMIEYFVSDYEQALARLAEVGEDDPQVRHQASWYEANAFLALNRPMDAMLALERLRASNRHYQKRAASKYDELSAALGINSSAVVQN